MTGFFVGVLILVVLALVFAVLYLLAKHNTPRTLEELEEDAGDEVKARLLAELRKWQAEAAHWKATAERLQRELDGRQ